MPEVMKAGPSTETGPPHPTTTHAQVVPSSVIAEVVAAGATTPASWLDLRSWTMGYTEGWDARDAMLVPPWLDRLAQDLAQLDATTFLPYGRVTRQQRIAREVADDRHATPVRQTDDWPTVAIPGGAR